MFPAFPKRTLWKRTQETVKTARSLLAVAELKLRQGKVCDAMQLFEEIIDVRAPSLERLAALSYLRSAERKPPRRVRGD
jgi:hypothetical protein